MTDSNETTTVTTDEEQQLKFVDARASADEQVEALSGTPPIMPFNKYAMPGSEMTAKDIMKHPVRIDGFQWTPTDTPGTQLYTVRVPEVIASLNSFHRLMLMTYAFFKPAIQLKFVMNSTKFHVGRLIVSLDPFHQMLDANVDVRDPSKFWNRYSATGNPNTLLDAATSNVAEMVIPFEHIQDFLTTNSSETFDLMAVLRVNVLNQLRVATGTLGTVNVQVFLNCVDLDLHVPIHAHAVVIPSLLRADRKSVV